MGEGGGSCRPSAGTRPCPPAGRPGRAGPAAPAGGGRVSEVGREALASPRYAEHRQPRLSHLCESPFPAPGQAGPGRTAVDTEGTGEPQEPTAQHSGALLLPLLQEERGGGIFQHPPSGQVIPAEKGRTWQRTRVRRPKPGTCPAV